MFHTCSASSAVVPSAPLDCHVVNTTWDSILVRCRAGFDGGLPQTFVCEARHAGSGDLAANRSTARGDRPEFALAGVAPAADFRIDVYSVNAKGRSEVVRLAARTRPRMNAPADGVVKYSYSAGTLYYLLHTTGYDQDSV